MCLCLALYFFFLFCVILDFVFRDILTRKHKYNIKKVELQERMISERRKGNNITRIQESLDEMNDMNLKPDLLALNRGTAATLDRKDARNGDIDKDVMLGLNANDLSRKPATAYDFAFCFSLISFHFSWIIITKYLLLLIRSRSLFDTGTFLLADLRIDVQTSVHYTWLVALVIFLEARTLGSYRTLCLIVCVVITIDYIYNP